MAGGYEEGLGREVECEDIVELVLLVRELFVEREDVFGRVVREECDVDVDVVELVRLVFELCVEEYVEREVVVPSEDWLVVL